MLLHAQLEALCERHEVTLVAGVGDEPWEPRAAQAATAARAAAHLADRRRSPSARRRMRRRLRLASNWFYTSRPWLALWFGTPAVQAVIDRLSKTQEFDIVAVEDSSMATLRLPPGVPAILTEHEVGRARPEMWRPGQRGSIALWALRHLDRRRWEGFQRAAWRRFDRVQVFTPYDARTIERLAPDAAPRVRVNPFGLALPAVADFRREQPGRVLFVGNFTHPPNRDAAVWLVREIMPHVRAAHPQARLRLVGSGPPTEILRLAGPGIEVIGDVLDVDPYIEAACVCVAPVRVGGGMRAKVLYALARGKAVVTTTLGAEGYALPGRELPMVVADDAAEFAAAIAGLLSDAPRRHQLARAARAFAEENHSPSAWGARLDAVYEEAVRERHSSQLA